MTNAILSSNTLFGEPAELPKWYSSVWRDYQRSFLGDGNGCLTSPGKKDASAVLCPLFRGLGDVVSGTKERVQLVVSQHVINVFCEEPSPSGTTISLSPEQVTELRESEVVRYRRVRLLGHSNGEVSPGLARDVLDVLFSFYELFTPVKDGNKHPVFFRAESHELRSLPVDFAVEREFDKFYGALEKTGFAGLVRAYGSDSRSFCAHLNSLILKNVYESP